MATVTYTTVEGVVLTTSAATLYTAPSTVLMSIVRLILAVNTDNMTARRCELYKLPASGASSSSTMIRVGASNNTIAAGKTEQQDTAIFVAPSGTITGKSDANSSITVHMSVIEVSS